MALNTLQRNAIKILLALQILVILFHVLVLANIVPFSVAWGGNLQNYSQAFIFESFSITLTIVFIAILLSKIGYIKNISKKLTNGILWFYVVLFSLNTIGNFFAKTEVEKFFAIFTFLSAVLLLMIMRKDKL